MPADLPCTTCGHVCQNHVCVRTCVCSCAWPRWCRSTGPHRPAGDAWHQDLWEKAKGKGQDPGKKGGCEMPGEIPALWQGAVHVCAPVSPHVRVTCQHLSASTLAALAAPSCQDSAEGQSGNEIGATRPLVPPRGWALSPARRPPRPCRPSGSRFRRMMLPP